MNRKLFALLLCLLLCMTVLPVTAFAGDGPALTASASPYTGDNSNVALWIVIAVVALAAIVGIIIYLTKRKK